MTTVITRYFETAKRARAVKHELVHRRRLSVRIVDLHDNAEGLADKLISAHIPEATARAYEERVAGGGAVLLVRAGYKPLGVANITRDVTAEMGAVDMGGLTEEVYVKDKRKPMLSVLEDQPLMLTRPRDPDSDTYHMADWPFPLILRRAKRPNNLLPHSARLMAYPMPLLFDRKPYTKSIFPRHARMANFPIPLISRRKPYAGSIFPRHARMANFPIPLISRRKPYTGSIMARHARMANWPFPHLINGKTGTNALMPGGPRMANFPIPLLSRRKPYTGSIFPKHARMASFPIPLLSGRKPYTGSIFPRHARMANVFMPLVIRRSDETAADGGTGFSFSKMLGWRTIRR